jgi:hypothetical protein
MVPERPANIAGQGQEHSEKMVDVNQRVNGGCLSRTGAGYHPNLSRRILPAGPSLRQRSSSAPNSRAVPRAAPSAALHPAGDQAGRVVVSHLRQIYPPGKLSVISPSGGFRLMCHHLGGDGQGAGSQIAWRTSAVYGTPTTQRSKLGSG